MPIVDKETHEAMAGALDFLRRRNGLVMAALDSYRRDCEESAESMRQTVAACEADPELAARTDRSFITVQGYRQLAETNHQAGLRTLECMAELEAWTEAHTW